MATETDDRRRSPSPYLVKRDWRQRKGVKYTTLMVTFTLSNTSAKLILPMFFVADQLTVLEKNVFRASSLPIRLTSNLRLLRRMKRWYLDGITFSKKIALQEVVGDFEKAVWRAVQDVFPVVAIKGCGFHWSKIKNIGMTKLYKEHEGVRSICKQLMPLNLIPWQKVRLCWENLFYWIEKNTWPPSTWCVFMQSIRTSNDTEGWHTRLLKLAGLLNQSGMNLYSLIELLHRDASSLDLNLKLLFQHRTLRRQRIFNLWVSYNDSDMGFSTMDLLVKLSKVHCAKFSLEKNVDVRRVEPDDCNFND
uniref:MULE transposase domain-containing protein n=1 Tax=Daphnia galeata TaxID=27404 RepID=A0A8J2RX04_9CRUS|nr:unnamed protein product [Daphnia galeata]